jgi:hypothetical protein
MLTADDLKKLYWFNMKDIPDEEITKDYFFVKIKQLTGFGDHTPFFVYLYNGKIEFLESIIHDADSIDFYNKRSLHIFLYEPLCYRYSDMPYHNQGFYSEFNYDSSKYLIADELESIKKYVETNHLTNVIVHTGDYNCKKYFTNYTGYFNIICDDLFLKNQNFTYDTISLGSFECNRKFICLNWRYTKHRHLISSYIVDKNCNLSWYYRSTFDDLRESLWFDIEPWKENNPLVYHQIVQGISKLDKDSPFCLDINHEVPTYYTKLDGGKNYFPNNDYISPSIKNVNENSLIEFYKKSFCEIVTESRFAQPTGNFSEKVFKPIHFKKPFILVAPPFTLEYLKSLGFRTFDKFWDESYDIEINHEERLLKIFKVIDFIDQLDISELSNLDKKIRETLEYNYNFLRDNINKGWIR